MTFHALAAPICETAGNHDVVPFLAFKSFLFYTKCVVCVNCLLQINCAVAKMFCIKHERPVNLQYFDQPKML